MTKPETRVIETSSGLLQGYVDTVNHIEIFNGISYAKPPVGPLRFRPPEPLDESKGQVRKCVQPGKAAPQTALPIDTLMSSQIDSANQSEDCLYLNIWTPDTNPDAKRPVLFWVHTGACMSGSGNQPFWDGTHLAQKDVVVVTFNYRLGALGWMTLDHLSPDFDSSANLGMLDQIEAAKWVKRNIAQFGGDPDNIVGYGSSAGAACIMGILISPLGANLFKRVILQSPPMFHFSPRDWAAFKGEVFMRSLGLTKETLGDLRDLDIETILEAQTFMTTWPNFIEGLAPVGPAADGKILRRTLISHYFHHPLPECYKDIEIIIGYTRDEFNFFFPFLPDFQQMDGSMFVRTYFAHIFGHKHAREAYEIYKNKIMPLYSPPSEIARYMASDVMCRISTLLSAENLARNGHKVYLYEWDYESNDVQNVIKAAHMVDAIFSWDNLEHWKDNPFLGPGDDFERDRIAKQVSQAIVQFAKTGNPNYPGIPHWPVYNPDEPEGLCFDREVHTEKRLYANGINAWKTVLKDYVKTPLFPVNPVVEPVREEDPASSGSKKRKLDC